MFCFSRRSTREKRNSSLFLFSSSISPFVSTKQNEKKQEFSFYTLPEYEAWREERGGAPGWKVKYYKGGLKFFFFFGKGRRREEKRREERAPETKKKHLKKTRKNQNSLSLCPGLGTSTEKEAKAYFSRIDSHRKKFVWRDDAEDGGALELAFSKKKIEERKAWLAAVEPGTFLDQSQPEIGYSDFVHRELVLFSWADLER